jgi:putative FmdB family regulatory protein
MPIYEYACMECESHFEELVRGDQQPACPHCGAANVRRQLSVFVAHGSRSEAPVGGGGRPTGGCCGGACGCG